MTFITNIILISFLIYTSTAFTALSVSNVNRGFATTGSPTGRFYINNEYSYEVGIGKNLPLASDFEIDVDDTSGSEQDVYEAARFMVEYESVQKFPSPLDDTPQQNHEEARMRKDEERTELNHVRTNQRKSLPNVEPKRQLEDVLFILTGDDLDESSGGRKLASTTSSRHPVMVHHHQNRQIDINSIWVEMLIHDQQKTASAALQRA